MLEFSKSCHDLIALDSHHGLIRRRERYTFYKRVYTNTEKLLLVSNHSNNNQQHLGFKISPDSKTFHFLKFTLSMKHAKLITPSPIKLIQTSLFEDLTVSPLGRSTPR